MNCLRNIAWSILCIAAFFSGCDSVFPGDAGTLVIETYVNVGQPLPTVRVTQTTPLSSNSISAGVGVENAVVSLSIDGVLYDYKASSSQAGVYEADGNVSMLVPPGAAFELIVQSGDKTARAVGMTPPRISISDIRLTVSSKPVAAVLLDSLDLGFDSLNLGLDTRTGFIYPVQVAIDWPFASEPREDSWIESRLRPVTPFSSTIVDFFLRPSAIFSEKSAGSSTPGMHTWEGVYAVPVKAETDPFPEHTLSVAILRSDDLYARYASSRLDPTRREPLTNLTGAVGFVGGVSIDSVRVVVRKQPNP